MRTLTLVTQKGGAGKTTLAASLAVAAAEAGERVAALDLDPQGSLASWGDTRTADDPAVDRIDADQLPSLQQILGALKGQGYTLAILDTAGFESTTGNLAMQAADLCLIPARPSRLDLQATLPTIETLMRLDMRDRFAFILNQCPPGRSARATEAANGLSMFGILAEPLVTQRADHQDALAAGQGVTEYAKEGKAAEEVRALWNWIARKVKGEEAAMTKRPSLIAGLNVVPPADAPAASSSPESAAPRQAKPAGRKPRPDIVHTSVYLPRPVYKRLREIAFTTDQKIHDVIMEGVDAALKKYGHPGVEALKAETRK